MSVVPECGTVVPMGKRTSVYLTDELAEAIKETGLSLAELLWRGISEVPGAGTTPQSQPGENGVPQCPHPRARRSKGGLCMACGQNVEK